MNHAATAVTVLSRPQAKPLLALPLYVGVDSGCVHACVCVCVRA